MNTEEPLEPDVDVKRRAMDRERKRLIEEQQRRMSGDRRTQHIRNAIMETAEEETVNLQDLINNGMAWRLEGSMEIGRAHV